MRIMEPITLKRLSLLMMLMYLHPKSGHSALITFPRDTEVLINHSTYFNCSTSILSEQIHWYHNRVGENRTNYVYYKGQFNQIYADRYSIEINIETGEYNLIIRSVQSGDAGRYVCQDDGGLGDLSSAELIVLESTPTCLSSMKPDGLVGPNSCYLPLKTLQLSCSVSYIGNIPPTLQWKMDGYDAPILGGTTTDYSGKHATVNLTTNSTVEMDGDVFMCGTTRSQDKQLSCSTDQAKINYAVGQPTILNITKGETIRCSVNASVPCTYRWFYGNDTQDPVSNGQVLTTNRLGDHSCEASCPISGISCTFIAIRIIVFEEEPSVASEDDNKMLLAILIPTVVILLIIACVGLLFFIMRKGRNANRAHKDQMEQPPSKADDEKNAISEQNVPLLQLTAGTLTNTKPTDEVTPLNDSTSADNGAEEDASFADIGLLDNNIIQSRSKQEEIIAGASKKIGRAIAGVAALEDVIYVVSHNGIRSEVEMYDIETNEVKYRRTVNLKDLEDPWDLTSCKLNKCLYIMDRKSPTTPKCVIRVDPTVEFLGQWSTGKEYGNLSVTCEGKVVVTICDSSTLLIYSPDGKEKTVVSLSEYLIHPTHALKLRNGQFLICYGINKDNIHRVSILNENGGIAKSSVETMKFPSYLIVNKTGLIFVADQDNRRVIVLNSDLELIGEVASEQDGLRGPQRLFLHGNRTTARLCVVDNIVQFEFRRREGKVFIFTYCRPNHNK